MRPLSGEEILTNFYGFAQRSESNEWTAGAGEPAASTATATASAGATASNADSAVI